MKLKRVLVVYKKSSLSVYAHERKDKGFLELLKRKDRMTKRFLLSHGTHARSLETVRSVLKRRGIAARYVYRSRRFTDRGVDLIITVGGDGTFLEASHSVRNVPILGVNSSPDYSVGMFCGVAADGLDRALARIEADRMPRIDLARFWVRIGGKRLPVAALNDALVVARNPAATMRYFIRFKGREEEQKSSGIWIATPAGSTAAICSAGGKILPLGSGSFQFLVRELYVPPGEKCLIRRGIGGGKDRLSIRSKLRAGMVYLDGPHLGWSFPMGTRLEIDTRAPRLRVFGFNVGRRKRFG